MKKNSEQSSIHSIIIILLILNIIIGIAWLLKEDGAIKLEKLRAGGKENFAAIMDFYKSDNYKQQQAENIPSLLKQMEQSGSNPTPTDPQAGSTATAPTTNTSIKEAIAKIRTDGYVQGKENARYTLVEYSDLECPFCKRHFQNGTIKSLVDQYPDQINYVLRHFPLQFHANAKMAWEAMECAAELKDPNAFYDMTAKIFGLTNINKDAVINAAEELGINKTKFSECLNSGKYGAKVDAQMAEWQSLFGIRWTPGNVIVDSETGRFIAIPWAFPVEKFVQELQTLIANE
jgi:protein-disulfide isomerase